MSLPSGLQNQPKDRLPPAEVAREVAAMLWSARDHFLRVGVVPIIVAFAIETWTVASMPKDLAAIPADAAPGDIGWVFIGLLAVFPMTLFAVNCQRLVLLGPSAVAGLGLRWGGRETRFLASAALISMIAGFAVALPATIVSVFVLRAPQPPFLLFVVMLPFYFYLVLRLSFALTAAALDSPGFIGWSWRATRGIGVPFLIAAMLTVLPLEVAVLLFSWLLGATGLYEVAPFASHFLSTLTAYLPAAAMSVTIALVYRRLQGHAVNTVT